MRKNRRSSSQHQSTLMVSEQNSTILYDHQNVKKMLLQCYKIIRTHVKQQKFNFDETELTSVYKSMSKILKIVDQKRPQSEHAINNINDLHICQKAIKQLKQKLQKQQERHSQVVRELIQSNQAQICYSEGEYNKKLVQLGQQFNKRQSCYKELIKKFSKSLSISQQSFDSYKKTMEAKNQKLKKVIINISNQAKNNKRQIFDNMLEIIEEKHQNLMKGKQNTSLLNKKNENSRFQDSQSYQTSSIQMEKSIDRLQQLKKIKNQNSDMKNKRIDLSSIEKVFEDEDSGQFNQGFQQLIQRSLFKLICFGFFTQQNDSNIKNIMQITKNLNHYSQIFSHTLYPLILQNIKMMLDKNQAIGNQLIFQSTTDQESQFYNCNTYQTQDPFNMNGKVSDFNSQGPIRFRNIDNLRDLDISDSVL